MPTFSIARWFKGEAAVEPELKASALKKPPKVLKKKGNIDWGCLGAVAATLGRVDL